MLTSIKEPSIDKRLFPKMFQANCHHVDPISIHGRLEGTQLACPKPTERSSKPPHEEEDGWFVSPQCVQCHFLHEEGQFSSLMREKLFHAHLKLDLELMGQPKHLLLS